MQATDHGDAEISFLYLDPWMWPNKAAMWSNNDLRRSCRHKLRTNESDIRYCFPRSYFFPLCQLGSQWKVNQQPALIIFIFIIVIFLMAIPMIIVTYIRLRRPAISFEGMKIKSALSTNRWNFELLCKFRHCTPRETKIRCNSFQALRHRLIYSSNSLFPISLHFSLFLFETISNH